MKLFKRREVQPPAPPAPSKVNVTIDRVPEVTVRHVIERKIPRPTRMVFVWEANDGRQWRSYPVDLSYRDAMDVEVPMSHLADDQSMPPGRVRVQLEYDPRDRS